MVGVTGAQVAVARQKPRKGPAEPPVLADQAASDPAIGASPEPGNEPEADRNPQPFRVTAKQDRRRRIGFAFTREPTIFEAGTLDVEQGRGFVLDPLLDVEVEIDGDWVIVPQLTDEQRDAVLRGASPQV